MIKLFLKLKFLKLSFTVFFSLRFFLLVIKLTKGQFIILISIKIIKKSKVVGEYSNTLANVQRVITVFRWRVRRLFTAKYQLLQWCWERYTKLFQVVRRVSANDQRCDSDGLFFLSFPFSVSSSHVSYVSFQKLNVSCQYSYQF